MNSNRIKSLIVAAIACACFAIPATSGAQRRPQDRDWQYGRNQWNLRDLVNRVERESNSFRDYFEHNFRSNGHEKRYTGGNHGEHEGRFGQMTLRDAIQNLDEEMERIRNEVNRNGRSRRANDLIDEALDHASDVDRRLNRVTDWYEYQGSWNNRGAWRYDHSELSSRWRELRGDINELARAFNIRSRW